MLRKRSRRPQRPLDAELRRRTRTAAAILGGVLVFGTVGYMLLGLSPLDAVYQTVVTVSTVGYREVGDVTGAYKVFVIVLIMVGAGTVLYTIGAMIEVLIEGRITREFGRRRMARDIDALSGHIVVCGWGQVGRAITETLEGEGRDVVVIDREEHSARDAHYFVHGDATDDEILSTAGVERAGSLVVAMDSAADNVYVTLSGRSATPGLFIVARATSASDERKLFQAGADRVVNPHQLGGAHMAALVTQPNVAEFLDIAMHDRELAVFITEVPVPSGSQLCRGPLGECDLGGAVVLAVRQHSGNFVHHPVAAMVASPGDVLIALGTAEDHANLRAVVSA